MPSIAPLHDTANKQKILSKRLMIESYEPPDWTIEGVLQRRFIYSLTGQTGHAKTAIALLIAELVSSVGIDNPTLGPHRVEKGNVLYLVGENPDDVTMRLIGADSLRSDPEPLDDRIWFLPGVVNLPASVPALEAVGYELRGLDLVIIDTSAAYFLGAEENSNTEIGDHACNLRALVNLPGEPTVLVLCHPQKWAKETEELIPRGGGAFLAEIDGNLTLRRLPDGADNLVELHHSLKWRGPGFEPLTFRLEKIIAPKLIDAKGQQIPTVRAALVSPHEVEAEQNRGLADEDKLATILLKDPGISIAAIAQIAGWMTASNEPQKSRVHRTILRLEKSKLAVKNRTSWELTEKGKDLARKIAIQS